jgi:hypothetical protein
MPIIVYIEKIVFLEKKMQVKKREIRNGAKTISFGRLNNSNKMLDLVNKTRSTLSTTVLSFKLITLIVIEKF